MLLFIEFVLLMFLVPLALLFLKVRLAAILVLWLAALLTFLVLRRHHDLVYGTDWNRRGFYAGWRDVLQRFVVLGFLLTVAVAIYLPEMFLSLPKERPLLWLAIFIIYPVLSVWPQEMIYRTFIEKRYQPFFDKISFPLLSALSFAFLHVIFLNVIAVVLTGIGGYMFAKTYCKYQSLALVCFEHSLYGCLIFTIGLGKFFFLGAAWK